MQEVVWGAALPPRRRHQYWSSRALLRQRVAELLGRPPLALPLQAPPGLPPRLKAGAGWVGLSHSGPALLVGWAPLPIGVDLEAVARPLQARALMRRFFPQVEVEQLECLPPARLQEAVLGSWVLKEAAIKWRRRRLAQELSAWWFDHDRGLLHHPGEGLCPEWHAGLVGGWRWGAVAQQLERVELHVDRLRIGLAGEIRPARIDAGRATDPAVQSGL
jgi:phosphopantetheinyl transferase